MRRDPTSEKSYSRAIQLIESTFQIKIRKVNLLNITKNELKKLTKWKSNFLSFFKGFYLVAIDTIYIVDGNEEDQQTFIHETLHSNSILHHNNSPIWLYEGLTKALTEFVLKTHQLSIPTDYYLQKEKELWVEKLKVQKETVIQAYFSKELETALKLLKSVLKTNRNPLELSFSEL